jgi:hypothetical protein
MNRKNYSEVRAKAQAEADADGFDRGLEKFYDGYSYRMLPEKRNRCGHELRCEVVMCSTLSKCQPGHGPMAKS